MQTSKKQHAQPEPRGESIGSITIGADGRIYCHDIEPGMVEVLDAVCGGDAELEARRSTREAPKQGPS